ncbi:tetratricopeptide repeat protein [Simiduia sp. 21SJ11W-1]|uniref:tetratricopeptide repeat protein n=1 Tax=Simiduia sp. 21SJ11W-1 TaxID=2909669 RepID=UPI00209DA0E6|nr:tetratricopeptide repeat protein [Simiduia sp. 21SJ11W-1]UTA46418.1 tetratricopeptide repeat protein [Simiduia sp. 21SJ11W-1]
MPFQAAINFIKHRLGMALGLLLIIAGCSNDTQPINTQAPKPANSAQNVQRSTAEAAYEAAYKDTNQASFVGNQQCASCHEKQHHQWQQSHHAKAMAIASDASVLGNFNQATFTYNGITSVFYRKDGNFMVRTDNAQGELEDFSISYTFGTYPLQQYLIDIGRGKIQALGIAWDARPTAEGGQRWFHLYPNDAVDNQHFLHWTARDQNWNYMCAECHSTNLKKNYNIKTDSYNTHYAEINVACEACHGPASNHIRWAETTPTQPANKGLTVEFGERQNGYWQYLPGKHTALRTKELTSQTELNVCARCHSRRSTLNENFIHGSAIGNSHRVNALSETLYHPDGQPKDETFVLGSFLQSKMHSQGVTCSDCHNPHSTTPKLEGNTLCAQCHNPGVFDTPSHHHHTPTQAGSQCVDCHMPVNRYMGVDDRRDHSFRIPRPDLSAEFGVPNTCNSCHSTQTPEWASKAIASWHEQAQQPFAPESHQQFTAALAKGRQGLPEALTLLIALTHNPAQPAIARASAIALLAAYPSPRSFSAIVAQATDASPLVRRAVADALTQLNNPVGITYLEKLLADAVTDVQFAAASGLLEARPGSLSPATRKRLSQVLKAYVESQQHNADRPEAWINLGNLAARQQELPEAEKAFQTALKLNPKFAPAIINLADLYRATGRDKKCVELLAQGVDANPNEGSLHYALALARVREKNYRAAATHLNKAVEFAPTQARYAYALAAFQNQIGNTQAAVSTLNAALAHSPFDPQLLTSLRAFAMKTGNKDAAALASARLKEMQQALN